MHRGEPADGLREDDRRRLPRLSDLGRRTLRHGLAARLAGEHRLRVGCVPEAGSFLRELASFARVIMHDQRGIGLSSRDVALADLETRVADLQLVLDAPTPIASCCSACTHSGGVNALFAATDPARVRSLVWIEPGAPLALGARLPLGRGGRLPRPELAALELWGTPGYGQAHTTTSWRSATSYPPSARGVHGRRAATPAHPMSPRSCPPSGTRPTCGRSSQRSGARRSCCPGAEWTILKRPTLPR